MLTIDAKCSSWSHGRRLLGNLILLALPVFATTRCAQGTDDSADPNGDCVPEEVANALDEEALAAVPERPHARECDDPEPGSASCHARVLLEDDGVTPYSTGTPHGFRPADLQRAYEIPTEGGKGATVAIVDAFDDPSAESDLAVYRETFGLPPCTTQNGCFRKVNQKGKAGPLPAPAPRGKNGGGGWASEIALDLDMVSAACPRCNILLVETDSNANGNLYVGIEAAAALGATVISNSWGGGEGSWDKNENRLDHPGIAILASTGDHGYGVSFPASSPHVIAVGGTSLSTSKSPRGFAEKAWKGAGSGCSGVFAKPSFQTDKGCSRRSVADVSAVADPNTGVAVYNTHNSRGWLVEGGTSASTPLFAAILAATGRGNIDHAWLYTHPDAFHDVTTGSNGTCSSSASYLCTAEKGYDGPTGLGTPDAEAFVVSSGGKSSNGGGQGGSGSAGGGDGGGHAGGASSSSSGGVHFPTSASSSSSSGSSGGKGTVRICK